MANHQRISTFNQLQTIKLKLQNRLISLATTAVLLTLSCTQKTDKPWKDDSTLESSNSNKIDSIKVQNVGALGDVKYSVLPPEKFKEENGAGWVLMDDKVPLKGSDLSNKHGITAVPDVRGLFIRSLNLKRNDDKSDPFAKEQKVSQRLMGDFQLDAVGKHNHKSSLRTAYIPNIGKWDGAPNENFIFIANREAYGNAYGELFATDATLNSEETRPKNISLYTYIKIND